MLLQTHNDVVFLTQTRDATSATAPTPSLLTVLSTVTRSKAEYMHELCRTYGSTEETIEYLQSLLETVLRM